MANRDSSERGTSPLPCMNTHHPITTEQFLMTDRIFSTEMRVDALRVLWHPLLLLELWCSLSQGLCLGLPAPGWRRQSCRTSSHSSAVQLEHRECL